MIGPAEGAAVRDQEFTAPDRPIRSIAGPIKTQPNYRLVGPPAVIRQAGGDVGVVVLDLYQGERFPGSPFHRVAGRQVIRVEIAGQDLRLDVEQALVMLDPCLEGPEGFVVFHVADVVADKGILLAGQAEGIFQLCAGSQHRGDGHGQPDRVRSVAARPADECRSAGCHPRHRVVDPHVDRPVVEEKCICQGSQPLAGIVVFVGNGFLAQVPAGHHQQVRKTRFWLGEKHVQRGIRQHDPEGVLPGGDFAGHRGIRAALEQDDRSLPGFEQLRLPRIDKAVPRDGLQVRGHQREGLVAALLAPAQLRDGLWLGGVAGQVKAAQPLDRQDLALPQVPAGCLDGLFLCGTSPGHFLQTRPAGRRPGRRPAGHGNAGRGGSRTPSGSPGTWESPPWSSSAGRRGYPG